MVGPPPPPPNGVPIGARLVGQSQRAHSRSPRRHGAQDASKAAPLADGQAVQFFHTADPISKVEAYVCPTGAAQMPGLQVRQSHGWIDGTVCGSFSPESFDLTRQDTWPLVRPRQDILFADRCGVKKGVPLGPQRVLPERIRAPTDQAPALSLVFVRWGGMYPVNPGVEGDGGWGKYGCIPSDEYMSTLVSLGVMRHPALVGKDKDECNYEIFSVFVRSSKDMMDLVPVAPLLAGALRGRKKAIFWMLWPAEWEDTWQSDFAGYVERRAFFAAMRACEAAGLRSAFPHPADLYELLTSKTWMSSLALCPEARLPAATLVSKSSIMSDPMRAAKQALMALEFVRSRNPFPVRDGERPAPSTVNVDGVTRGVVKLGWSWEGRFVLVFHGVEQLCARLTEIMSYAGCTASSCIVQEWVDFDFEMRLYFLPPAQWEPGKKLTPVKVECNSWGGISTEGRPHTFRKLTQQMCLERWQNDAAALTSAREQATDIAQFLLAWLLTQDSEPVPMVRMDFMLARLGPGRARVAFGEYCEMGACCLAWEEGPPTIWRAALDYALR